MGSSISSSSIFDTPSSVTLVIRKMIKLLTTCNYICMTSTKFAYLDNVSEQIKAKNGTMINH